MTVAGGFSIQAVAIEGFKGFTTRQEIDLEGRHLFLLGQNGRGKSSIVEAVRWGLFGSARRPNEVIANRGYTGRCRVEIELRRDGRTWNLRRTLIRGASGGSDAQLTDQDGTEQPMQEIMPHLDSVDTGEGMHIIFSPQSAPLRRQPEDLSPFERTIFSHLGLTHPRALLSHLASFKDDQETLEVELSDKLTEKRKDIDKQLVDLERRRNNILVAPPWDGSVAPSRHSSEIKAKNIISEITNAALDGSLDGASIAALIYHAEDALNDRREVDQSKLIERIGNLKERLALLHTLQTNQKEVEEKELSLNQAKSTLDEVSAR